MLGCGRIGFDSAPASDGNGGDGSSSNRDDSAVVPQPKCTTTYQGAVFCEDFETDLSRWFPVPDGANIMERDVSFARSGAASLHVIANDPGSARLIAPSVLGAATSGQLYVRFYQWLPTGTIEDISILHLVSDVLPYPGVIVAIYTGDAT